MRNPRIMHGIAKMFGGFFVGRKHRNGQSGEASAKCGVIEGEELFAGRVGCVRGQRGLSGKQARSCCE
jgi:hypothetical protein